MPMTRRVPVVLDRSDDTVIKVGLPIAQNVEPTQPSIERRSKTTIEKMFAAANEAMQKMAKESAS